MTTLLASEGTVIFEDRFERAENDDSQEQPGNGWGTNSQSRAQGNKQVDLADGALHITRHPVADHGVSVVQDLAFQDAVIEFRFQLGEGDDLGINIADMKERSVHAGHICMARFRPDGVELTDLKTGRMKLETRTARKAGTFPASAEDALKQKTRRIKAKIATDQWHEAKLTLTGDTLIAEVDGKELGAFSSPGIAHATKSRIRLAVNRSAWIDDIKVTRLAP
ncbi:MAG: family 16 glycoside hydrolase [Planctomycetota bacterium]